MEAAQHLRHCLVDCIAIIGRFLLFFIFLDLFTERACPQLAKANLGGPCLNKQITKKYTDKMFGTILQSEIKC